MPSVNVRERLDNTLIILHNKLKRGARSFVGQDLIRDGRRPKNWRPKRDPLHLETSVPGIFAAGDVRHGVIRRVASAMGQGVVAVSLVDKYLETV